MKPKKIICFVLAVIMSFTIAPTTTLTSDAIGTADSIFADFKMMDGGEEHTFVIKTDGSLWGWGSNEHGQLGDGTTTNRLNPVKIMDDVASINSSDVASMAIKTDGSLWAWGKNDGQLGDGTANIYEIVYDEYGFLTNGELLENNNRLKPIKIMDDVIKVYTDYSYSTVTYVLKKDNTLWGCGIIQDYGKGLGYTSVINYGNRFTKILDDVKDFIPSDRHCFAIKKDDSLWAWGANWGQLFDNSSDDIIKPKKVLDGVKSVSSWWYEGTLVIKKDGRVLISGIVGRGINRRINNSDDYIANINEEMIEAIINRDNIFYIKSDNSLWCGFIEPEKLLDDVQSFTAGYMHNMAVKTDGSLWTWGYWNDYGQLGDGTTDGREDTPVKIMDGVVLCRPISTYSTFIIKSDGSLWACGNNEHGQLGDGTTENRLSPVKIMDSVMLPSQKSLEPTEPTAETSEVGSVVRLPVLPGNKGFNIYRSEIAGETGNLIAENIGGKTFVDVNVEVGKTYHYTVETILPDGSTVKSVSVSVTIQDDFIGGEIKGEKSFILMTINDPLMSVDGVLREIDPGRGTVPLIKDNRTLVPIRSIVEAMNCIVEWNGSEGKVTIEANGHSVVMWLNNREIIVDGEAKNMDVAPQTINDRTMVPVRFVAENIGCQIAWIGSTQEVIIVFAK